MIAIKLGGSLQKTNQMKGWIAYITKAYLGQALIIPGGGIFADDIREKQKQLHFDDETAHRMAILSMTQMALLILSYDKKNLVTCRTRHEILKNLKKKKISIWDPYDLIHEEQDIPNSWEMTSDSLSIMIARQLGIKELIIIKSCPSPFGKEKVFCSEKEIILLIDLGILDKTFHSQFLKTKTKVFLKFSNQTTCL